MATASPLDVVKYWHQVEFFTPFDLEAVVGRDSAKNRLSVETLLQEGDGSLSWLNPSALEGMGAELGKRYRYQLYLLPFDKSEVTEQSRGWFSCQEDSQSAIDFEERSLTEGLTCFAKLAVSREGIAGFLDMSVSTLPWAIGKMEAGAQHELTMAHYHQEKSRLKQALAELPSQLPLTAESLLQLLQILKTWAGFEPAHQYPIVVEMLEEKSAKEGEAKSFNEDDASADGSDDTADLPILNSFYIRDLERVCNDPSLSPMMRRYLLGAPVERRVDLYDRRHVQTIMDKLDPAYLNHGRWPRAGQHYMSLMQQFAIQQVCGRVQRTDLFSVNGPPGTGKTTLLQDVIAETIVRRAKVLATFESVLDGFCNAQTIEFEGIDPAKRVWSLNPRLTGFEMVVVSSNNKAVENISKELPLRSKWVGTPWAQFSYFAPIATKVAADQSARKPLTIAEKDRPWGLIAAVLGNKKNRDRFCQGSFFEPLSERCEECDLEHKEQTERLKLERIEKGEFLTIWEWRHAYTGPSFAVAKEDFQSAYHATRKAERDIRYCQRLDTAQQRLNARIKTLQVQIDLAESFGLQLKQKQQEYLDQYDRLVVRKKNLQHDISTHQQLRPSWFDRVFRVSLFRRYRQQQSELLQRWTQLLEEERKILQDAGDCQARVESQSQRLQDLSTQQEKAQQDKELAHSRYQQSIHTLGEMVLPLSNGMQEGFSFEAQVRAVWQTQHLNELRSELFTKALALHEAWMMEALAQQYFSGNLVAISKMLSGATMQNPEQALSIWQSLFIWVPVVSSTFASIEKLFQHVGREQLGLVLIDEAGQVVPQAAVGILWRAKRALVVGDPLQVEPVFTVPCNVIEGLAQQALKSDYERWLPHRTSVQVLADQANKWGAYTHAVGKPYWIGCPLQVHRRCLDPMFSVANHIAYGNKMLQARKVPFGEGACEYLLGESRWFDIGGQAINKHYVPQQGEWLLKTLKQCYDQNRALPDWYVITPFKRVKQQLQSLMQNSGLGKKAELKVWCQDYIGTVHAVQGREARVVILVLGADVNARGAVAWASSKPNLLNVALTRAQDRFYVVGDYALWSGQPYFSALAKAVPVS